MNHPVRDHSGCNHGGCINLRWALALFDGLVGAGLRHLVLSPGSRSTPLLLAAQRHQPRLALQTVLDERSAAFLALGLAQASGRPTALLCTSGSAPAHWLPAVIEASASATPLILLSADRPPELRGWGANQTIDQSALFSTFVREFHDPGPPTATCPTKPIRALGHRAMAVSQGPQPGPVHLNLPFREPLVPAADCDCQALAPLETIEPPAVIPPAHALATEPPATPLDPATHAALSRLLRGRGLICCGPGRYPPPLSAALWRCSAALGLPVLCDPLSGLRYGPLTDEQAIRIASSDSLPRNPEVARRLRPDWVLRLGRAPVSKALTGWLADIPTVLLDPHHGWSDPNHDVALRLTGDPAWLLEQLANGAFSAAAPDWVALWRSAERQVRQLAEDFLRAAPWCEPHLLLALLARLDDNDGLLIGNSLPVRQLDGWSGARAGALRVFGNRGASGIDGQASTLAGLNIGGVPTTALLGDLSFLHDLGGIALLRALDRPCIVLNNGGGRIFDYLPQRDLAGLERHWRVASTIDIGHLLAACGVTHRVAADAASFAAALDAALAAAAVAGGEGAGVIEVHIDAERSQRLHQQFWRELAAWRPALV